MLRKSGTAPFMDEQQILRVALCTGDPSLTQEVQRVLEHTFADKLQLGLQVFSTFQTFFSQRSTHHLILVDLTLDSSKAIEQIPKMHVMHPDSPILLITDHLPHVSRAYTVPHFCLFIKGYLQELPFFLHRAAEKALGISRKCLELHVQGRSHRIPLGNVCYLERRGHITYVYQTDGTVTKTREKIDTLLHGQDFESMIRCHVAYAVNLMYVKDNKKQNFVLASGTIVPISRVNQIFARSAFQNYIAKKQKD